MPADELEVPADAAGERLDVWLARVRDDTSRARIASLIDDGAVLVDGMPGAKGHRLRGGERITIAHIDRKPTSAEAPPEPRIAWENQDLLIVDKPPGLVVHPAPGHRGVTMVELLAERAGGAWEPLAVHRLDRDTSGLMIVAKRREVLEELQSRLRAREITREYVALVEGR